MIKEIDFDLFHEFGYLSSRYFELYPTDDRKTIIFSAKVNISFGIQDINNLIDKINKNHNSIQDSSWFYELMVKAYQVSNAVDMIMSKFEILKSKYNQQYGEENEADAEARVENRQKFDYFRALRSLTTAHTLETTFKEFKKFNINADTFLEDVRTRKSYRFTKPDVEGDIILEVRTKDNNSIDGLGEVEQRGVFIDKDIIETVKIIISTLTLANKKVSELINEKEYEFKQNRILDINNINDRFLLNLKEAVKERYPKQIEVIEYENDEIEESWEIQEIFDFVTWDSNFDDERSLKVKELQDIKKNELLQYAEKVQNMTLSFEDHYILSSGISSEGIDYYPDSKINAYLKSSNNKPDLKELKYWFNNLSAASQPNAVSDELWGALQLKKIQPKLDSFFQLDWNTSYQELYWQYLVALFVRHQDSISHVE